ncbi:hypothetical protein ONA91_25300 [Micromonospora sp. DR5-3]|uniref:hypothetical protein n=1 Tax=unclassified Micromonospora TaxID=2617518 RepID=UPI0011D8D559|nr:MULTISPECIES: hypothetical protein [unclassified Micromonospora]MCW3817771.1 hypothetical protein [Micromonospora sp. DR5-3]TYC20576.1 hypothetical protein FXF52_30665 [Micromonospora sp. MP36]
MPDISPRLRRRINADFPQHTNVVVDRLHSLDQLVTDSHQDAERMFAAVVRLAQGRLDKLDRASRLAREDWRDLLVGADFGNEDWPDRLAAWLDASAPTGGSARRSRRAPRL